MVKIRLVFFHQVCHKNGGLIVKFNYFTAFAEYFLMKASESYSPFMDMMTEKITMSKIAIEFLSKNPEATYEDLINKIQVCSRAES